MSARYRRLLMPVLALTVVAFLAPAMVSSSGPSILPYVSAPSALAQVAAEYTCPTTSGRSYVSGYAFQYDRDNPVRPAYNHADKNLALRSYSLVTGKRKGLVSYPLKSGVRPPQFATLFNPYRVPPIVNTYRVYNWNWAPSPDPGTRGVPLSTWSVTAIGLKTTPGEVLRVPVSGYDIGSGMEVIVLFADADSITLRYTREDSSGSRGYTVHVDHICTDPNLLALYRRRDNPTGPRYRYVGRTSPRYSYPLPAMPAGKVFGRAAGTEVVVAITDTGSFMDPRSCREWWLVKPNYSGTCPTYD